MTRLITFVEPFIDSFLRTNRTTVIHTNLFGSDSRELASTCAFVERRLVIVVKGRGPGKIIQK